MDTENDNEVLTFREAFLGSRALELLVAGCAPLSMALVNQCSYRLFLDLAAYLNTS